MFVAWICPVLWVRLSLFLVSVKWPLETCVLYPEPHQKHFTVVNRETNSSFQRLLMNRSKWIYSQTWRITTRKTNKPLDSQIHSSDNSFKYQSNKLCKSRVSHLEKLPNRPKCGSDLLKNKSNHTIWSRIKSRSSDTMKGFLVLLKIKGAENKQSKKSLKTTLCSFSLM